MKRTMKRNVIAALTVCSVACLGFGLFSTVNAKDAFAADEVTTEIAFSETKLNVSKTGNKMLIVTAINHAEYIGDVCEIGYEINGYTVAVSDFAETDKYYDTITLGESDPQTAADLGFKDATESSKLLIWEVAYNSSISYEINAYAKLISEEKIVNGTTKTNTFTVTYQNEGGELATESVNYNAFADLDAVREHLVEKNGYTCGWVDEDGNVFTATTPVKGNVTLSVAYTGIKLDKQVAEEESAYVLAGETLAMPTDVNAAASGFYQDEYTLTWKFGEREVSGATIALAADEIGTETEALSTILTCTAVKADGSDEHVVYEKKFNVYKIREVQLDPMYVTANAGNLGDGSVHILFGTHDDATDGAVVSAVVNGETVLNSSQLLVHEEGKYYSQPRYYENGSNNLVVRCEKKIVYQTINKADAFVKTLADFNWYQTNRSNLYVGLSGDITLGAPTVSNVVFSEWATTFYKVLKNNIDGFGHSINAQLTGDMHLGKVTNGQDNPFTGIFENINAGLTLKNIQFNLDITLPCMRTRIIGNLNAGATIDNCVFNINANNDIKANVGSTDDGWGKDHQWGEALFGVCAGTVKNSLFINKGLNNYQFALNGVSLSGNKAAHVENCVFVNWKSVDKTSDYQGNNVYYFHMTANENTKFWVFDTLENAVSGTFVGVAGYGTAPSDGGATISQDNAKALAEIFAGSNYLTVNGTSVLWNGVAL